MRSWRVHPALFHARHARGLRVALVHGSTWARSPPKSPGLVTE